MNSLDIYVAIAFCALVLSLGLVFSLSNRDMKMFFAAGGNVPWWISGLSLFMSFFSVGTFVVWGSIAYTDGLVAISIQSTMAIAGIIIGLIIAPAWNKTRILTVAEFITIRLGPNIQKLYSCAFLFINLFAAGAFLYPVGKIIEVAAGVPLETAIIGLGIFIILYTALGGLWAVLITDVLQFVVLTAAVLLLVPLAFAEVGGVTQFIERLPDGFMALQNDEYTWMFLVAFLVYNTLFIGGNWAYVQRFTSVSGTSNAKKVGLLFGGLYLVAPIIWMLPPMIYRVLNPDLQGTEAEEAYLLISKLVLPEGLLGLILGAMIFATASSVNTTLNISAGVLTNDLIKPLLPKIRQFMLMRIARLSTLFFGILAICVALMVKGMGGIVEVVLTVAAVTGAPLYLPPIWALFSKRQTGISILLASLLSLFANIVLKFVIPLFFDFELSRTAEMSVGVLVPIAILLIFEVFYEFKNNVNPDYENFCLYQQKMNDLDVCEVKKDIQEQPDGNVLAYKILSAGIVCVGFLILILGFIAEKAGIETKAIGLIIIVITVTFTLRFLKKLRKATKGLKRKNK